MDPTLCHVMSYAFAQGLEPLKRRRKSGRAVPLHPRAGLPQRRELGADGRAALRLPEKTRSFWRGCVCHAARAR